MSNPLPVSGKGGNRARFLANQKKYGHPLPIIIHPPSSSKLSVLSSYLPTFLAPSSSSVERPECVGTFDPVTRSVWVTEPRDMEILFNRGFFGKGTLSRSEPSWRERRIDQVKGGQSAAAEKIREARRIARKQFKIDRAQAMLTAAKAAEAVLTQSTTPGTASSSASVITADEDKVVDGSASPTLSATTTTTIPDVDVSTLTPQTFLIRPTRPDQNRNRGRKAFRRKPPPPQPAPVASSQATESGPSTRVDRPAMEKPVVVVEDTEGEGEGASDDEWDDELVPQMEHLQLALEEAWFLSAGLGVLRIRDPATDTITPIRSLLPLLVTPIPSSISPHPIIRPDDPFLVSYVAYHHFRSLGWVVKPGIKFCCDWLLYRRGPVFSHSTFSCVLIPVYEDLEEKAISPFGNEDWYEERMSWKWMNTIMRVNSLVQKTVVAVYITIPSLNSFPSNCRLQDGTLDPNKVGMRDLLKRYTIREVTLQRFGPARRRD
ncbi:hypothetical protein BCR39DRAFT_534237 [Naematelia encephala]|uniref:tRNA-splicing endonuclease subunit Sen2 n=1 Tax=Naematelia encephala TaxID=71784 RepID=A0A1Y2B1H1_9TREE|nr:hypothetical protein BCR39DRAFT_534237 [Naematelia encephala]